MEMFSILDSIFKVEDMNNLSISDLAKDLIEKLDTKGLTVAFAESMTGGLLASSLTREKNASKVFGLGLVVYSEQAKIDILGCDPKTIKEYSVYSEEIIQEMLIGLRKITDADILVCISGIAGPSKPNDREIGEVYLGYMFNNEVVIKKEFFIGERDFIQAKTVKKVFQVIIEKIIQKY